MSEGRILAVDDQLYFRVFLEDLLTEEGYEVATAGSAEEALDLVEQGEFDLVLTDLVMPGMDGRQLVDALRERRPDQDIIVVTSVGDVKTAVEAMKCGAIDYLLKPIDRTALMRSIDTILERRAMQAEQERLVAENLEYLGHVAQYERALGLFSTLGLEPLTDRLVEALCLETNAHGGVVWMTPADDPDSLELVGAGGLVRPEQEVDRLELAGLPRELESLRDVRTGSLLVPTEGGRASLFVALRHGGRLIGLVRLFDRLDGGEFDASDREVAERFALFASQAAHNALSFRDLQRSSFRNPTHGAYTKAYAEDVIQHELTKARRFGRPISLVRIELSPMAPLRDSLGPEAFDRWLQLLVAELDGSLRKTDLLAAESDSQFVVMLAECDSLGAIVAKRRIRAGIEVCEAMRELDPADRPEVLSAMASFPANGGTLDELRACLDRRIEEDRKSLVRAFDLETAPFQGLVATLLAEAGDELPRLGQQMTRALLGEVARNPHHRGLLFLAPRAGRSGELRECLEQLRGANLRTEVVVVGDRDDQLLPGVPVTWAPPRGGDQPFVVYLGEGASYALIEDVETGQPAFHTADPVVVEQLAFQLTRDLGIPIGD